MIIKYIRQHINYSMTKNSCILLDCVPGPIRPNIILDNILKNTSLTSNDFILESTIFGQWTFRLIGDKEQLYQDNLDIIVSEINKAYKSGQIRYAEW